jgi:nicotinamide-nucleotide amidase
MVNSRLYRLASDVGAQLKARRLMLVTAESCTGGWVGAAATSVAGSSEWYERGFVTYSNEAKQEMLGVAPETLARFGAVSEETAREMAQGALTNSHGHVSVAVTGVAGPGGGTAEKPVGMVCFAWGARGSAASSVTRRLRGDRQAVREQSVVIALEGLLERLR